MAILSRLCAAILAFCRGAWSAQAWRALNLRRAMSRPLPGSGDGLADPGRIGFAGVAAGSRTPCVAVVNDGHRLRQSIGQKIAKMLLN
jgi:hypothetical protein